MPAVPYVKNPTWADGSGGGTSIDAADLNKIEAGIHEFSYAPAVRVYHNAAQSITSGVETTLAFNSERFDQCANTADTQHDTAVNNSRLTCRYAGIYQISAAVQWAATPSSAAYIALRHQGATYLALHGNGGSGDFRYMTISTLYALAVNEYVEVRVGQTSGGAVNISASPSYSPEFMMVRVG